MRESIPQFRSGVFAFTGTGYEKPSLLSSDLTYSVPADKRSQLIYFRAGNSTGELIYIALIKDGALMRYFPIGAKGSDHVSLAVVEDLAPDTKLEVFIGAPLNTSGYAVVDIGLIEI
jgi:assimilatory nitrate reductase catalytic subunit